MARRQELLGKLEQPKGKRQPSSPPNTSPRWPLEAKAKAYAAYLDGASWTDCARAIGHQEPNGQGAQLIVRWADEDHWQRPISAGDYKSKVEKERSADPQRISDEVDDLCVQMQRVSEKYISQYIDEETGEILINSSFKTRDFADMAAALRMIHETRIKIRKANEPKDGGSDGKKNDFLSMIREAGLSRLRDNRRRQTKALAQEDETDDDQKPEQQPTETPTGQTAQISSVSELRFRLEKARLESEAIDHGAIGEGNPEA